MPIVVAKLIQSHSMLPLLSVTQPPLVRTRTRLLRAHWVKLIKLETRPWLISIQTIIQQPPMVLPTLRLNFQYPKFLPYQVCPLMLMWPTHSSPHHCTLYGRSKDSSNDPSVSELPSSEQTDSTVSSTEDPAISLSSPSPSTNQTNTPFEKSSNSSNRPGTSPTKNRLNFSSLSSLSGATKPSHSGNSQSHYNPLSSRPRAAFKGSTSTFIKSSEGLPMPQSLIRTFYGSSSDSSSSSTRDEGEERTFGFYTWNKSVTFVQLSPPRPAGETLVKLTFAAFPTHVSINHYTASSNSLDVVIGFSTGDLIYFDPFCARYTRLNKSGCISGSAVSKTVWLAPTVTRRDGYFVSSHVDGTVICWDKEREDWNGYVVEPWPKNDHILKSTPHPSSPVTSRDKTSSNCNMKTPHRVPVDSRGSDIIISATNHGLSFEKRSRLNPVFHWRVSKKAVTDVAFSPDSKFCAVVSEDGCLRIIDSHTERLLDTYMSYFGALLCVCWSSDGKLVFTGGQDDIVTAYSPIEQKVIARCEGHSSFVTGLSFDPWFSDERSCRFASVSEDCKLIFWDLSSASLAKPRLQSIGNHNLASRRQSASSIASSPNHCFNMNNSVNASKRKLGLLDSKTTLTITNTHPHHDLDHSNGSYSRARGIHPAPGRNEVAILQPVMVKEIGIDPLSSLKFHRDWIVISSRTGQIYVFGRPTPPSHAFSR